MIFFSYGLIVLRYSSVDSVLFLLPLLSYPILLLWTYTDPVCEGGSKILFYITK